MTSLDYLYFYTTELVGNDKTYMKADANDIVEFIKHLQKCGANVPTIVVYTSPSNIAYTQSSIENNGAKVIVLTPLTNSTDSPSGGAGARV